MHTNPIDPSGAKPCGHCGLVNIPERHTCKQCGVVLPLAEAMHATPNPMRSAPHIYYASTPKWSRQSVLPFIVVCGLGIVFALITQAYILLVLPVSVLLLALVIFHPKADNVYLIVSADGLEYHSPAITIKTDWTNLRALNKTLFGYELLLRHSSATYINPLFTRTLFSAPSTGDSGTYQERSIPLHHFDYTPASQLAQELQQHAPHLFRKQ